MGEGVVGKQVAILVLRASGIDVAPTDGGMHEIASNDYSETIRLPECLDRKLVHHLSRKFKVPIHHFFNPQMGGVPPNPADQN
ncbi:MAG TPA: hypothetical protein VMV31_00110 [Terriglobales bacterium]|nr:hypothetical protein [Terriglobales bacterium]